MKPGEGDISEHRPNEKTAAEDNGADDSDNHERSYPGTGTESGRSAAGRGL